MASGSRTPGNPKVRAAMQKLEDLQRAGITHLPKPRRSAGSANCPAVQAPAAPGKTTAAPGKAPAAPGKTPSPPARSAKPQLASAAAATVIPASAASASVDPVRAAAAPDSRAAGLAEVCRRVAGCARCAELARTRTQTVFGEGNPSARLVFMGEAPGGDEDQQGRPFVGAAGQKLTQIIVDGMRLRREDVYILNTLKCRPPGNRVPLPEEAANCREYLDQQLAIIQPQFICCLGAVASQNLLGTDLTIGRLRGRVHDYRGIKVVCTYHPAYLLRNPSARVDVWEDVKRLMSLMGLDVPKRRRKE